MLSDGTGIDFVINNAAILKDSHLKTTTLTNTSLIEHMTANVLGPARVTTASFPLLVEGTVVANVTSGLGSNGMLFEGRIQAGNLPYSSSKAAVNKLTVHQSKELQGKAIVVAIDPGHVKTDMGGSKAVMEIRDSVQSLLCSIERLLDRDSGRFVLHDGTLIPW